MRARAVHGTPRDVNVRIGEERLVQSGVPNVFTISQPAGIDEIQRYQYRCQRSSGAFCSLRPRLDSWARGVASWLLARDSRGRARAPGPGSSLHTNALALYFGRPQGLPADDLCTTTPWGWARTAKIRHRGSTATTRARWRTRAHPVGPSCGSDWPLRGASFRTADFAYGSTAAGRFVDPHARLRSFDLDRDAADSRANPASVAS